MIPTMAGRLPLVLAIMLPAVVGSPASAGDDLLYYFDGGNVVITNTPSRPDARPVPGFGSRSRPGELPATAYDRFIDRVAHENGLDPALVKVVALVESGFNPRAVSPKGARGIMQLMPATARRYGVSDVHDPYQSLRAGAEHLRSLLDEFGGDITLAVAAYNAGSGAVRRFGGVPAYPETLEYVRRVRSRLSGGTRAANRHSPDSERAASHVTLQRNPDGSIALLN